MSYQAYLIIETGIPFDHHAIFIETHEIGPQSGHVFNVIGNIQNGMVYEEKSVKNPEDASALSRKEKLGSVAVENYPRLVEVCKEVPVPKKQFQGAKRLYPGERIRRCQEWAAEAVVALGDAGVLVKEG